MSLKRILNWSTIVSVRFRWLVVVPASVELQQPRIASTVGRVNSSGKKTLDGLARAQFDLAKAICF